MNKLISTPDIVTLINNPDINIDNCDELKDKNIFSYMKIPNTALIVKNYICFDFNAKGSNYNDLFKNTTITIASVCHESDLNTTWGNRHDVMGGVIIESVNWSNFLGFQIELVSDNESILDNSYHVRTLQFKNLAFNSLKNGVKING
jgi:hypothetical protein